MKSRFILEALKDGNVENLTSVVQMYKAISAYRATIRGPLMEMQHLLSLIHNEKWVIYFGHILIQ